jgi:ATPase subunit of ABC transporter with duplicated ATPase domains
VAHFRQHFLIYSRVEAPSRLVDNAVAGTSLNENRPMAQVLIEIPGHGKHEGDAPIVILGPNGSGKTQLAQKIATVQSVSAISAQRRTWVDDNLPVQEEASLRSQTRLHQDRWRGNAWLQIEDFNFILSTLIQEHTNQLTKNNEKAITSAEPVQPLTDSKLMLLQSLWNRLFPKRKLEIGGFFPRVRRLDGPAEEAPYHLRQMSDGERTRERSFTWRHEF